MQAKATSATAYLAALPADQRKALEKLRRDVLAAAPDAEECITYGMPGFRLGKPLVAYAAAAGHCSLYPMSGAIVAAHAKLLAGYDTSKGTIRFPASKPLPASLVRTIVRARMAEISGGAPSRPRPRTGSRSSRTS